MNQCIVIKKIKHFVLLLCDDRSYASFLLFYHYAALVIHIQLDIVPREEANTFPHPTAKTQGTLAL